MRGRVLTVLALLVLTSSGCGGDAPSASPAAADASAPASPSLRSATLAPPSAAPPSAPPSAATPSALASAATPSAQTSAAPTPGPTAATDTPAPASASALPRPASLRQGGRYWAVVVAVSTDPEDAVLARAVTRLRELGYTQPEQSDLDCLQGAREALGLLDDSLYSGVSLLFADRGEAQRVADAVGGRSTRVAQVSTFCLD